MGEAGQMPPTYIPSVRARRLARSLREAREQAGLSQSAVGASLSWSQQKVGHIENCRNKADEHDVDLMLALYGVQTPEREALMALAREAERRNWWSDYADILSGPYVALEDAASEIREWEPQVIPGLLQTQDYARELITGGRPDSSEETERRLKARMLRQTLLTRPQDPPRLHVILDEAILERPIGSPDIMSDQLYRLRSEARRPNVTIQVLPKSAGTHPGLDGSVIVLGFDGGDPDVGYAEGFHGAVFLESPHKVAVCRVAFERLSEDSLDPEDSAALIEAAAKK